MEGNGSTSSAMVYKVKKMNSPDHKSPSGTAPHCTLPSYPGDYHPSSCLNFMRSLPDWKLEVGKMHAIATGGGWDLEGGGEFKNEGRRLRNLGARKQNEGV
jgi:hypothetical protein